MPKAERRLSPKAERMVKLAEKVSRDYLRPTSGAMEAAKRRKNERLLEAGRKFKSPGSRYSDKGFKL